MLYNYHRKDSTELWDLEVVCAGNALQEEMAATRTLKIWPSRHLIHLACSYHASRARQRLKCTDIRVCTYTFSSKTHRNLFILPCLHFRNYPSTSNYSMKARTFPPFVHAHRAAEIGVIYIWLKITLVLPPERICVLCMFISLSVIFRVHQHRVSCVQARRSSLLSPRLCQPYY